MRPVTTERGVRQPAPADPPWVRALFLAPAVAGSVAALVLIGRTSTLRRTVRRWLGRDDPATDLDNLRASIVGQSARRVTALFGPPPAATSAPAVTWYYPVASSARTAMAVTFDGDTASRVEFFQPPA